MEGSDLKLGLIKFACRCESGSGFKEDQVT